ncbi:dimethylarginine dimethylaminohydrolase [uncultured Roseibium sp.]|uniref:dimethylarginine dimethylaminohydrolase n=1 Tax=uncultured Roseibium sp. TaxID=1936171 RepID=UPI0026195180|nr:dimethylarginine dimethylaminohydrolase [uncultured Roseibium sp.]
MTHRAGLSFQFTHAIARTPANSVANGIRAVDSGDPSGDKFREEHGLYIKALQEAGLSVNVLPALEAYPDSCFVEDPAFCLPNAAIQLRPGTESRLGEGAEIRAALDSVFETVAVLAGEGHVDGGDVLTLDDTILIGLSARTDREGADAFAKLLGDWGYQAEVCETPRGVLHFKTACSTLGDGVILATRVMAESGFSMDGPSWLCRKERITLPMSFV